MNRVKFIYNPLSGESKIISELDTVVLVHQKHGCEIVPFRINPNCNLRDAFEDIDDTFKYVLIAGGDGTVDYVVNCMKEMDIDLPIGIIPSGTANDFAKHIGMPENVESACEQILRSKVKKMDIGRVNDKYFVNVASAGLFTDISQKTDITLKNTLGRVAYYIKGLEQVPNLRKLKVKVSSEEKQFEGDMYLILAFNGQTAGNIRLAYKSSANDGFLDVIIFKAVTIVELVPVIINILRSEHLENDDAIVYFRTKKLRVECDEKIITDIDGERGPDFPLEIECIKDGIKVLGTTFVS